MPAGISQVLTSAVRHIPVLAYVNVKTPAGEWNVTPADFQAQMDWLENQGYVPQKLSDFIRWLRGELDLPKKSIVITFWDSQKTVKTNAHPILAAKKFKYNVFISAAAVENEATLQSGIFLSVSDLQALVGSGLCELHCQGYHTLASFKGIAVNVQQIYKASQVNLKWGGIGELVEDAYPYAPLIGTNNSLQNVVTTYKFTLLPRSYRGSYLSPSPYGAALVPNQVVARYLFIDQMTKLGTEYAATAKIEARKVGDPAWTTLKASWTPSWSQGYEVIALDAPFTLQTGVEYELRFTTTSSPAAQPGEVLTVGNWTAKGYGDALTTVTSNSSAPPGFTAPVQDGGDIALMESLAVETQTETAERAELDAQRGLNWIAAYADPLQRDFGYAHTYSAYACGTFFLPKYLRALFPLQLWRGNLVMSRWSVLDISHPDYGINVPTGWPQRQLLAAFPVSGLRSNTQIESTIDALSGNLWDYAPDWSIYSVALGYSHPYTPDFYLELDRHTGAYTHLTTRGLRWNADGSFASGNQDAGQATLDNVKAFMQLEAVKRHPRVIAYLHNYNSVSETWDPDIAHGVFQNAAASTDAVITLLRATLPTLQGVVLDFEACYKADRSISSAWIELLWTKMQAQVPGRILVNFLPYKTTDDPNDDWSGWCNYDYWPQNCTYANDGTYDETWDTPGPIASISWVAAGLNFLATKVSKAKILIGMPFYGHWGYSPTGNPPWTMYSGNYYDGIKAADDHDGTWAWDATARENYWQNAAGTWKGYSATPRSFKAKLDYFAGQGYAGFSIWAIGHADGLFYKFAEDFYAIAPLVVLPVGSSQSVTDAEGTCSVGSFAVEVLEDPANSLAAVMKEAELHGKKARLRLGYAGENTPQFPVLDTLEVDRIEVNPGQTGWQIQLVDPKRSFKSRIFTSATKEAPIDLAGNPMDILLMVYQNHLGIGQNLHLDSTKWLEYVPGKPETLINPNRYVDVATILNYRNSLFRNYYLEFSITGSEEGKGWIEKELYKALGAYSIVDSQGRISPRFWLAPPLAGLSPAFTFTDRNLVDVPVASRAHIINQLSFRMDYDGSQFQTELFFLSSPSISTYGLEGAHIIESKGLRSARQGALHANLLATKLFRRYGSLVPFWSIKAFHAAMLVEVGDLVALTHPLALDPVSNTRGITGVLCEVLEKQPDYAGASVAFKLLDVRYLSGKNAFHVAPSTVPPWTQASAAQKATYMFCASDSTGLMSDGVSGNTIYG